MRKLFITGATGFIGGFIVDEALRKGYEVHAAVRSSSSIKYLSDKRIVFQQLNYNKPDEFRNLFRKEQYTHVIHNAGITKAVHLGTYHKFNADFTYELARTIQEEKLPLKKFVFMSSLASYGPADFHPGGIVRQENKPNPVTEYGRSKLKAEEMLHSLPNLPYMFLRPTAVFGPRDTAFITLYKSVKNGLEIYMGDKNQQLTFIYVKDLARIVLLALESDHNRKAYFVSDGNLYPSPVFNQKIKTILNKKTIQLVLPSGVVKVAARVSESWAKLRGKSTILNTDKLNELMARNWNCDTQPLEADLGFKPEYDLDTALGETINWAVESKLL